LFRFAVRNASIDHWQALTFTSPVSSCTLITLTDILLTLWRYLWRSIRALRFLKWMKGEHFPSDAYVASREAMIASRSELLKDNA
ncbi:hypothetical protein BCR42DRAFT_430146, partial [Absidia repens]